jgi:hypothetical protein
VTGKVVALLDIALPWRVMQHIRLHSKAMVVVDHHVTAEADLARLPQENKIFDMKQSGKWRARARVCCKARVADRGAALHCVPQGRR